MLGYLPYLLEGALVSLAIATASAIVAVAVAFLAAFARLSSSRWLRASAACYVEFFRGTSLLVQLFWLFFVLPQFGVLLNAYVVAVLALGLNIGAYGSEVVRGAIVSTAQGQLDAAKALNMSPRLAMRRIVLPQAFVTMLLPWGNLLIILLKSTALVSLITIQDLTFRIYNLNIQTFKTLQLYTLSLVIYFCMAQMISLSVSALYSRATRFSRK